MPAAFSDVPGAPGALLLAGHVEVPVGATLVIDTQTSDVRLPSDPSGFATIISRGTITVAGTAQTPVRISSWDAQQQAPDGGAADGRSFVLQIGGRMDVDHGQFEYLGFGTGTSSGVAWRGAAPKVAGPTPDSGWIKVQGTVTNSVFAHNHFGAYTHQAQGMWWTGNTFSHSEEYGFDPHDFSNDFVVESNTAHHNGKHGFIFSRGCDGNVLRDNTAYANTGHGFMIDNGRSAASATAQARIDPSDDNRVTGNVAYDNAGSGVEIEGGTGNVVADNHLSRNDVGVRVKDRATASVTGNVIDGNVRYGVHVLDPAARAAIEGNHVTGPGRRSTSPRRTARRWGEPVDRRLDTTGHRRGGPTRPVVDRPDGAVPALEPGAGAVGADPGRTTAGRAVAVRGRALRRLRRRVVTA